MAKIQNRHTWGVKTAARLRAVQAGLQDRTPEDRNAYLAEEIEYSLEDVVAMPGETRESLLQILEDYFAAGGNEQAPATGVEPAQAIRQGLTTDALLDELSSRAQELTAAQRQKLAALTSSASPSSSIPKQVTEALSLPSSPVEVDEFLKSVALLWRETGLKDGGGSPLQLTRALKMLGIMAGGFRDLYKCVWPFWQEIAPREIRTQVTPAYPRGLEHAVSSFLTGGEVGSGEFHAEFWKSIRLLLSILGGMPKGAEDYGKMCERKYAPDAIADIVALEETGTDPGRIKELGRKCWDKYSQVARHMTPDTIRSEIAKCIAESAYARLKLTI